MSPQPEPFGVWSALQGVSHFDGVCLGVAHAIHQALSAEVFYSCSSQSEISVVPAGGGGGLTDFIETLPP